MTPAQKQNCMLRTVAINIQEEEEAAGEGQNEIINSQSALWLTDRYTARRLDWQRSKCCTLGEECAQAGKHSIAEKEEAEEKVALHWA